MLRAFTIGFEKVSKSCLLLLVALPSVIDTFLQSYWLTPVMIVYDVATKVLDTQLFSQHNIADFNSGIIFIVLFSHEKPLQ